MVLAALQETFELGLRDGREFGRIGLPRDEAYSSA